MVRRAYRQRSLVEVLLPDADKLWDPPLRRIEVLLDGEALVEPVAEALAPRHPESRRRGRLGTPAAVVLRMLVLKHLHDWSFDACEREVRGSLVEIVQRSRTAGARVSPQVRARSKARMKRLYQGLIGIARAVLRHAQGVLVGRHDRTAAAQLPTTIDLLRRAVA